MPWDPKKTTIQFQCEPELKETLRRQAKQERRSLSEHCVWLLERGVERMEREIEEREKRGDDEQPTGTE